MTMIDFKGIIPAAALPMTPDFEIDEKQLAGYIDWLAGFEGLKGVAVNMDTGEGPHLDDAERALVIRAWKKRAGDRLPILAGICGRSTREAETQARAAAESGADALVVFPPPVFAGAALGPKIPVAYHEAVARASGLPLVLFQLQPALAGAIFTEETLVALASLDCAAAIKEASFDAVTFVRTAEILRKSGARATLLTGNDNFIYESFLLGAVGALIGFGTIAVSEQIEMHRAAMSGLVQEGMQIWERIRPLEEAIFAVPVRDYRARMKAALAEVGAISCCAMRPPLFEVSEAEKEIIRAELRKLKMI
ncbi:MAG TPA: dihydrodipicolinate synthase family protein [bacterium]|nr:dihydrodipicolinate synthase family protein [bacterium]